MSRVNIYVGPRSLYASVEDAYVPGEGVAPETLGGIIALILRDAYRGWSYSRNGARAPFNWSLADSRLKYLIALATRHSGESFANEVRRAVEYALSRRAVPPWLEVRLAGPMAGRVAEELVELGVVGEGQVYVAGEKPLVALAA